MFAQDTSEKGLLGGESSQITVAVQYLVCVRVCVCACVYVCVCACTGREMGVTFTAEYLVASVLEEWSETP